MVQVTPSLESIPGQQNNLFRLEWLPDWVSKLKSHVFIFQLIKCDVDGTIDAIQNKLDERALLRQKKVLSLNQVLYEQSCRFPSRWWLTCIYGITLFVKKVGPHCRHVWLTGYSNILHKFPYWLLALLIIWH